MKTKVLVYEDSPELRSSLVELINFSENLELAGAFENCSEVLKHIESFLPDLILSDIDMPVVDGIQGLKRIRSVDPDLPVIMLTVFEDSEHVLQAIMAGANGYILKKNLITHLENAIKDVLNGGAPMSPVVAKLVLKYIGGERQKTQSYKLTQREKEILLWLTDGLNTKAIAVQMDISPGTVATHIKNIYEKMGVHSQAEAAIKAIKERII